MRLTLCAGPSQRSCFRSRQARSPSHSPHGRLLTGEDMMEGFGLLTKERGRKGSFAVEILSGNLFPGSFHAIFPYRWAEESASFTALSEPRCSRLKSKLPFSYTGALLSSMQRRIARAPWKLWLSPATWRCISRPVYLDGVSLYTDGQTEPHMQSLQFCLGQFVQCPEKIESGRCCFLLETTE